MRRLRQIQLAVALGWVFVIGSVAWAGDTVRPIDSCGHLQSDDRAVYIVTRNIFSQGQDCLIIESSHVTLDLNGFIVWGQGSGVGISASAPVEGITIKNGIVQGFSVGISLGGSGNVVENVHIDNHTDTGMILGAGSLADHVVAQGNQANGIIMSSAATIRDSSLRNNGNSPSSVGLSVGSGSTVTSNTIWGSIGTGLFASLGSTVIGNTVSATEPGVGMSIICPSGVHNNTATANTTGNLFLSNSLCVLSNNVAP